MLSSVVLHVLKFYVGWAAPQSVTVIILDMLRRIHNH